MAKRRKKPVSCYKRIKIEYPHKVYIIHCAGTDYYKIGLTRNLKERVCGLQLGCPFRLYATHYVEVATKTLAHTLEAELHAKLSEDAVHREWFELTLAQLEGLIEIMV